MFHTRVFQLFLFLFIAGCVDPWAEYDPRQVFDNQKIYETGDEFVFRLKNNTTDLDELTHSIMSSQMDNGVTLSSSMNEIAGHDLHFNLIYAEQRIGDSNYGELEGSPIYLLQYEGEFKNEYPILSIIVAPEANKCCFVSWVKIAPYKIRISKFGEFNFENKSFFHYLFFILLLAVPTFIIFTAFHCGFNKNISGKWFWIPLILLGFWGFEFNWGTGKIKFLLAYIENNVFYFKFLKFNLLGAGIVKFGQFSPWLIKIGFPIAAIVYWYKQLSKPKIEAS